MVRLPMALLGLLFVLPTVHSSEAPPAPRVEIVALPSEPPSGLPVAPWVGAGDAWKGGESTFDIAASDTGLKAKGWIAVNTEAILFHVVVTDQTHFNERPDELHAGDSLQLGIDALGSSPDQPPALDIDAEVAKLYGPTPDRKLDGEIKNFRKTLEREKADPESVLSLRKHDADYCVGLSKGVAAACSYYHGQNTAGPKPNVKTAIVRDETAKTTTYDFAIPWSDMDVIAGISPVLKAALFVNDVNAKGQKPQKTFWGGGIGGKFAPFRFNEVTLGAPAADYAAAMLVKDTIDTTADYAQAVIAVKTGSAARIEASFGAQTAALEVPAGPGLRRFAVRGFGLAGGSAQLQAKLTSGDKTLAAVSARIFNSSTDAWYVFKPANDFSPGRIGLQDWVEKPVDKHGMLHIRDGQMVFDDGVTARFLGGSFNNLDAEKSAAFLEKYGITAVRLMGLNREFCGFGSKTDSTQFDPELLDKFDKLTAAIRARGIRYQLCLEWRYPVQPGDAPKLMAYQEALKAGTNGLENFAPDIQDLRIQAAVNILKHKNPYSGVTYAEDAALYCMEIQNESDIFWYSTGGAVGQCPTYRAYFCKQFSDWLKARYGSQEKLLEAWGSNTLNAWPEYAKNESLEQGTFYPALGAWFFGFTGLKDQEQRGLGKRLLDTAEFLHETQNKYYQRFDKSVRNAGYKGMLIGSNWQADSGVGHYYNLLSDRLTGVIDRHNYWGGMGMWFLHTGLLKTAGASMLDQPGCGLLSTGMQQVSDRPFSMTEWMVEAPSQWQVEGPCLMAAYGLGLQGWSAIYASAVSVPGFTPTVQAGNVCNGNTPAQLVLYPALARMVLRGDVRPGQVISTRCVSNENLRTGKFNFTENVAQSGDLKEFGGDVPAAALAAGRVLVQFVDQPQPSTFPDIGKALQEHSITSNTGQLTWYFPGREQGHFTINTDGTKALIGFAPNREFSLGDVKLQMDNKYGALFVTALEKDTTLANCKSALVTAVARARNTGMVYGECTLDRLGRAPVTMEPITGSVTLKRKIAQVFLLDHDGKRTETTVSVQNNTLVIDGARHQTPYYEVVFE